MSIHCCVYVYVQVHVQAPGAYPIRTLAAWDNGILIKLPHTSNQKKKEGGNKSNCDVLATLSMLLCFASRRLDSVQG